ncbi:GNAT family N-acetyltransferase [Pantoea sp. Tr-811]|uniref:GNAT family N-acetyltransferase n=1 Tax=Pantoea sp. Tr-811 TaxID=2608361 RepID=UPI0014225080|nr:GNAT family N-acetyltransferase [Pantoea sp. Tr-811]NIF29180.1 GNAT family N-acetyltransferase [Pantoea sp. Tr-811]
MAKLISFEPLRDFFQRRQAARLDAPAIGLQLVTLRSEALRGNFVFPGLDVTAAIELHGQRVGTIDYGVSPLNDRLYISEFEIHPAHQGQGLGLATLWCLSRQYGLPLASMHEVGLSTGFWAKAEQRLGRAGVHLQRDIRSGDQPAIQATWAHLVPEPEHERLIRELMASPEWPAIKARMDAEYGPCRQD